MPKKRMGSDPLDWVKDTRKGEASASESTETTESDETAAKSSDRPAQTSASTRKGLHDGWKRHTFIVRESHIEKVQAVSFWERKDIKEVIDEALSAYLEDKDVQMPPRD